MRRIVIGLCAIMLVVSACSRTQTETFAKKATRDRTYGNVERVAVLPFDTLTEGAAGPKNAENVLIQELLSLETFKGGVEESRYVAGLMKKLKLRSTEALDREIVQKIGQELGVDALIVGWLLFYGEEETSKNVEFSIFLNMLDVKTGDIIWSGRSFIRSSTTFGEVFGLSDGPSINDLATDGILDLADEIDDQFESAREIENEILMKEASPEDFEDEEYEEDLDDEEEEEEEEEVEELLLKVKPK